MGAETEGCSSQSRAHQPVVIRVGTDPNPNHLLARLPAEGAIVISDPNGEAIFTSPQTPETERGVTGISSPQLIVLDGEILNFRWQCLEQFPEPPGSDGYHAGGGHSRRRPLADSLSASSKRKSSLPAEASASNWSSHRLCSRTRNHWTMRRYSSGGRPSIAASICSTRPMLGVYHHRDLVSSNAENSR